MYILRLIMQGRINPQEIAAQSYSKSTDPVVQEALKVLKAVAGKPVRAIVARPSVTASSVVASSVTDNIASVAVDTQSTLQIGQSAQVKELRAQYNDLAMKYAESVRENTQLKSDLAETCAQLVQFEEDKAELTDNVEVWKAKYEAANTRVVADARETERFRELVESLTSQLSNCGDYDSILSQLINAQENVNSLEDELAVIRERGNTLAETLRTREEELERTKNNFNVAESELKQIRVNYAAVSGSLDGERASHSDTRAKLATSTNQCERLQAQLTAAPKSNDIELARLTVVNEKLRSTISALGGDLASKRTAYDELLTKYKTLDAERTKLANAIKAVFGEK
jgi:chromosome segregation ATPase